jgi:hypothetical protein
MKFLVTAILAVSILFSCDSSKAETSETTTTQEASTPLNQNVLELGCYGFTDGKSTIMLDITENKKEVKGTLSYALAEKDKNEGTFSGTIEDDILMATYVFQSEGVNSTRILTFKIDGNKLIEGYGKTNSDGIIIVSSDGLTYNSNMPLERGKCNR